MPFLILNFHISKYVGDKHRWLFELWDLQKKPNVHIVTILAFGALWIKCLNGKLNVILFIPHLPLCYSCFNFPEF
jgi:hypothetical protein